MPRFACRSEGRAQGANAVSVLHDADGNESLNRNVLGVPTEGFAFSRAARGILGPPAFEDAAIRLDDGTGVISLELAY